MMWTSSTTGLTASGNSVKSKRPPGSARPRSAQVVEDPLHVLVLLEAVHQLEHAVRLVVRQLRRRLRDVLELGGDRRDLAVLERLRHVAEVRERAAQEEMRLALLAHGLAQLLEAGVDQVQLE